MSEPPETTERPAERLARYRRQADDARRDAARAGPGELRELYLALAQRWDALADDFEKSLKRA
jgi:hypothetical protein